MGAGHIVALIEKGRAGTMGGSTRACACRTKVSAVAMSLEQLPWHTRDWTEGSGGSMPTLASGYDQTWQT